jgi:KaiC/GvpD/RAD55 family RecA-like ATPase
MTRLSTGVPGLNELLGGGLLPGTLTVVVGATGIGKTQLGLQFADAGLNQEGRRGVLFDMSSRGDSQNHAEYARRMFAWDVDAVSRDREPAADEVFDVAAPLGEYLGVFDYSGRRVTRRDLGMEAWQEWQAEVAKKLGVTIGFFYRHFLRGVRRTVIDGMEPVDRPSESIQFELFEYVYHQILRKDAEWVARDLLREHYRAYAERVAAHAYASREIGCVLLYTTHETMLERMIERPLDEGDVLANANTIILMGKIREGTRTSRALYIPKHRGSAVTDDVVPYVIGEHGLRVETA